MRSLLAFIAAMFLLAPAFAQDKPLGQVPGELFFTIKNKQPFGLERIYPGITAAIGLTDEQKLALYQSIDQTIRADALRDAVGAVKSNPNATAEEKEKASRLMEEAREKLRDAVKTVLKPEQAKLVEAIQGAFEEAQKVSLEAVQAEFSTAKGDAEKTAKARQIFQDRVKEELANRLDKILTPEQKDAVQKAGAEQKAREEDAKTKVK